MLDWSSPTDAQYLLDPSPATTLRSKRSNDPPLLELAYHLRIKQILCICWRRPIKHPLWICALPTRFRNSYVFSPILFDTERLQKYGLTLPLWRLWRITHFHSFTTCNDNKWFTDTTELMQSPKEVILIFGDNTHKATGKTPGVFCSDRKRTIRILSLAQGLVLAKPF
jgi:hypothetical protein